MEPTNNQQTSEPVSGTSAAAIAKFNAIVEDLKRIQEKQGKDIQVLLEFEQIIDSQLVRLKNGIEPLGSRVDEHDKALVDLRKQVTDAAAATAASIVSIVNVTHGFGERFAEHEKWIVRLRRRHAKANAKTALFSSTTVATIIVGAVMAINWIRSGCPPAQQQPPAVITQQSGSQPAGPLTVDR